MKMKLASFVLSQGRSVSKLNLSAVHQFTPSLVLVHTNATCKSFVRICNEGPAQYRVLKRSLCSYRVSECHRAPVCKYLTNSGYFAPSNIDRRGFQHVLTSIENTGKTGVQAEIAWNGQRRLFQTTPQRHIPPVFWFLIKPVAKLGAILSGRTARKWWRGMPDEGKQKFWDRVRQRWYYIALAAAGLAGAGVVYYQSHIEETPFTGRKRFITVTHNQFLKIAEAEADGYLEEYEEKILPEKHPYYERVKRVGARLTASNPNIAELMNSTEWKYYIIDDPTVINAFVLPTGQVFVFTGILDFADQEDQLAMVIAHEMAHALLSHAIESVSYFQLLDFLIITTMAAIWCVMPTDGISFITQWFYDKFIKLSLHMPYSRMLEKEADKVGLQLAAKACYDVRQASVFWARMALMEDVKEDPDSKLPEWLSTHPTHENRTDFFDHLVPQAVKIREEAQCPMLPATDPREAIKVLSSFVDELQVAKKSGQNLSRVLVRVPPGVAKNA